MTLSHQWSASADDSPKLTQGSMAQLCQSIDLNNLPIVFRDAVLLTRRFGIRYLWIDRLCIIQDSPTDWAHEAALMGSLYASSFCSIAASDADRPETGCFMGRDSRLILPWHQKVVASNLFRPFYYLIIPGVGISKGLDSNAGYCSWRTMLDKSSLYSRGWVLQESILAPRIIHCSRRQLY
jgi:Heterokaryon incompatibility protein (HET)